MDIPDQLMEATSPFARATMWDEVLCGYGLAEQHHDAMLVESSRCLKRWIVRGFDCGDEMVERLDLLERHWQAPMRSSESELMTLVERYLVQVRRFARQADDDTLLAMADNRIRFVSADEAKAGNSVSGEGNTRFLEALEPRLLEARTRWDGHQRREVDSLGQLLDEVGWLPELQLSLRAPLEPVEGFDADLFLRCWIGNASVAITPNAVNIVRRVGDSS